MLSQSKLPRALLLPRNKPIEGPNVAPVRKLIIVPDGNRRADEKKGTATDYTGGAKSAIEIGEQLLKRQNGPDEVSICVMSQPNVNERSNETIAKISAAFAKLAILYQRKEWLPDIKLKIDGDLEALKQMALARSGLRRQVLMNLWARCKALEVLSYKMYGDKFTKTLTLRVNYEGTGDADLLIRSGVEEGSEFGILDGQALRTGAQSPPEGETITAIGTVKLWPEVKLNDVDRMTSQVSSLVGAVLDDGYERSAIEDLLGQFVETDLDPSDEQSLILIVPFDEAVDRTSLPESMGRFSFEWVPAAHLHRPGLEFDLAISPNQVGAVLPHSVHDQTVVSIPLDQISSDRVTAAVQYHEALPHLKGSDRPKSSRSIPYTELIKKYQRMLRLADSLPSDAFAAKLFAWIQKISPATNLAQVQAAANYFYTCFFMGEDVGDELKISESLAKYMGIVYLADEVFFDAPLNEEDLKSYRKANEAPEAVQLRYTNSASKYFVRVLSEDGEVHVPNTFPRKWKLQKLLKELQKIRDLMKSHPDKKTYQSWLASVKTLFGHFQKEWEQTVTANPMVDALENQESDAKDNYSARYIEGSRSPEFIKDKLRTALDGDDTASIRLLTYLLEAGESIGAGAAYKTAACGLDETHRLNDSSRLIFEEVCALSDMYFRLLNDLAEEGRAAQDRESKIDTRILAARQFELENDSKDDPIQKELNHLKGLRKVYDLMREIESELNQKEADLMRLNPKLGKIVDRAKIARVIYKEGHYRSIPYERIHVIMKELLAAEASRA